jgi:hypothetical protein
LPALIVFIRPWHGPRRNTLFIMVFYRFLGNDVSTKLLLSNGPSTFTCIHICYLAIGVYMTVPMLYKMYILGFEDLTAVVMKDPISLDLTSCIPLRANRLHLQDQRIAETHYHELRLWFPARRILSTLKMEATCSTKTSERVSSDCMPPHRRR